MQPTTNECFPSNEKKGGIYSHSVAGALKEIYKGESKVDKDQTIICAIFENAPPSADAVAAAFIQ